MYFDKVSQLVLEQLLVVLFQIISMKSFIVKFLGLKFCQCCAPRNSFPNPVELNQIWIVITQFSDRVNKSIGSTDGFNCKSCVACSIPCAQQLIMLDLRCWISKRRSFQSFLIRLNFKEKQLLAVANLSEKLSQKLI